ncbi:hypothetical protein M422DRAFT_42985 [Sphaerobolus stellatus SS14]|nr:hypothetical protein M422DRAFT_42985 [Sphaerobolus stellatus SS14]
MDILTQDIPIFAIPITQDTKVESELDIVLSGSTPIAGSGDIALQDKLGKESLNTGVIQPKHRTRPVHEKLRISFKDLPEDVILQIVEVKSLPESKRWTTMFTLSTITQQSRLFPIKYVEENGEDDEDNEEDEVEDTTSAYIDTYPSKYVRNQAESISILCFGPVTITPKLMDAFSDLISVEKVSVNRAPGETLLPCLVALTRLQEVSWRDVSFTEEKIAYNGLAGLRDLQFFIKPPVLVNGRRPPIDERFETKRVNNLTRHILASSQTLSSIRLDNVPFYWHIPEGNSFPYLTDFTLIDPICTLNEKYNYPTQKRVCTVTKGANFATMPRPGLSNNPQRPSRGRNCLCAPKNSTFFESSKRSLSNGSSVTRIPTPRSMLTVEDSSLILKVSHLISLEELRLSVMGVVSPQVFLGFVGCLPKLKIFELHNWRHDVDQPCYSLLDFADVFARLQTIEELRLDMHLVDDRLSEDEMYISAETIAKLNPTTLRRMSYFTEYRAGRSHHIPPRLFWNGYELVPDGKDHFQVISQNDFLEND